MLLLNPPNAPPQPFFNSFFLNSASGLDRFGPFHFSHCYPAISSFLFWANVIHAHLIFSPSLVDHARCGWTTSFQIMGRHHHLRLPEHLYLSPPTPPQSSASANYLTSASSFFAVNRVVYYPPAAALFQETGRSTALAVGDRIPGFKTSAGEHATIAKNKKSQTAF